jgi:UV DNA damage repair endonuclease
MHDFGYVALNMKYVNPEDSGTYTCRAINELGQAVTSASLIVNCKEENFKNVRSIFNHCFNL